MTVITSKLPSHHANDSGTAFVNPWPPVQSLTRSAFSLLKFPIARIPHEEREEESTSIPDIRTVPLDFKADFGKTKEKGDTTGGVVKLDAIWMGHAGFLLEFTQPNVQTTRRVLFDPIFSERASPSKWFGPKRRLPPPCSVDDLPEVHFVVISHNHYDHLEADTLQHLHSRFPDIQYLVPLGVKPIITSLGVPDNQVDELDWWEEIMFGDMEFVCTPAQHNSGRGVVDQCSTLWASWVVRMKVPNPSNDPNIPDCASVYFAGDTGYQTASGPCPAFKEIGERHGPFDLALIPIWRGASLSFLGKLGYKLTDDTILSTLHATPEDALLLQQDVQARHALGMHFATFAGSVVEAREPVLRLLKALRKRDEEWGRERAGSEDDHVRGLMDWRSGGGFGVVNVGERVDVPVGY